MNDQQINEGVELGKVIGRLTEENKRLTEVVASQSITNHVNAAISASLQAQQKLLPMMDGRLPDHPHYMTAEGWQTILWAAKEKLGGALDSLQIASDMIAKLEVKR